MVLTHWHLFPPLPPPQVSGKTFMPLTKCSTDQCTRNKSQGRLQMQARAAGGKGG